MHAGQEFGLLRAVGAQRGRFILGVVALRRQRRALVLPSRLGVDQRPARLFPFFRPHGRDETILWFTKSDDYVFNLDAVRVPSKYRF